MEELSKNKVKFITSLTKKKNRDEFGLFLAEGPKLVNDLTDGFHCAMLVGTSEYWEKNENINADEKVIANEEELKKISLQRAPQSVMGIFEKKKTDINVSTLRSCLSLALDTVQDPGNLGTIIRIADWFGIEHVLCSRETADVYNPKVVQATMGAMARVNVHYVDLLDLLSQMGEVPIYGAFLEGATIYDEPLSDVGVIVMGNEGNGISGQLKRLIQRKLYIPNYPRHRATSESLNVAVATAIVCSEFRRRKL